MKKLNLLAIGVLVALTGCKDLEGVLSVREKINLKADDGRQFQIPAGNYSGALKVSSKKKVNLELKFDKKIGKATFAFKTDQDLKKLKSGDRIQVSAKTSGQAYAIDGIYNVNTTSTHPQRSIESCTYTTVEWRCRNVTTPRVCRVVKECHPNNPSQCQERNVCTGGETRQQCGNENVSHRGDQEVEYYYSTTTESVRLQLVADQKAVSDFSGSDSSTDKHYTYKGICR